MRGPEWGALLPGSMPKTKPQRNCDKCATMADSHNGVEVSGNRWHCFACWRQRLMKTPRKSPLIRA